jgi:hypothetical protein
MHHCEWEPFLFIFIMIIYDVINGVMLPFELHEACQWSSFSLHRIKYVR